eukprot:scaffold4472_cov180-Amphora_coffeaeformis.AAC.1
MFRGENNRIKIGLFIVLFALPTASVQRHLHGFFAAFGDYAVTKRKGVYHLDDKILVVVCGMGYVALWRCCCFESYWFETNKEGINAFHGGPESRLMQTTLSCQFHVTIAPLFFTPRSVQSTILISHIIILIHQSIINNNAHTTHITTQEDFALTPCREVQQNKSSTRLIDTLLDTIEHNMDMMRQRKTMKRSLVLVCGVLLAMGVATTAFAPTTRFSPRRTMFVLHETTTSSSSAESLPEISEMKLKEVRQELESYGISTKAFLEKPEFIAALEKARKEGMKPKTKNASTKEEPSANGTSGKTRAERMEEEMKVGKSMSVADLRKELNSRGINTKAFFEKSDFVKAYAEAIVDGVKAKSSSSSSSG